MSRVSRTPHLNLATVLTQQNPRIDLKLEQHDNATNLFLRAVDDYANRAAAEIIRRRNEHVDETKRGEEEMKHMEAETTQCKVKEIELISELSREQDEKKESEMIVAQLRRQLASIKEKCMHLDEEIGQRSAVTSNLQREQSNERQLLASHATSLEQELADFGQVLGCFCEGIDSDQLLFRFADVYKDNEASFVLDVSERSYRVLTSTPHLPSLPNLLDDLNESRDLFAFLKEVRLAFAEMHSGKQ
ncbi:hypothetical protein PUNSTDRAFT_78753 [Punctularia strigosozonata HHB-11173 SS5]|uniref:uncharacterized protein n=1 Tax=Punctularia strigosozonata (strain HHB-11173) TaxID=741275 RepID=UPI0004417B13|nr:uncharacterized protein PUNSTDRAFT_78753 [Punctularia strigosozonata HHB-11173 SS5]EIN13269.1 hypothetical protein PUNSTDRAFT_78753 [Punctularia strigosozonata HHB-11173 SS5]